MTSLIQRTLRYITALLLFNALFHSTSLLAAGTLHYKVVAVHPHDAQAWTQGLYYMDSVLYESTGLYQNSSLRRVDLKTGKVLQKHRLADHFFAEGMTLFNGKLYQLTWKAGAGFVYDPKTFEVLKRFSYRGEGWGLTHNKAHLIMSDGTALIRFLDPEDFTIKDTIIVREGNRQIADINELEYVNGYIYANVWYTDDIIKIDPKSGQIVARLDLSDLYPDRANRKHTVLNGIAYDMDSGHFLITGKFWDKLFVLEVMDSPQETQKP